MNDWSRRNLLRTTAGAAVAVPMVAISSSVAKRGGPDGADRRPRGPRGRRPSPHSIPCCSACTTPPRGEVSILHGENEVVVVDRRLVARILQPRRPRRPSPPSRPPARHWPERGSSCRPIARHRRSRRIRSPTTPTPTRSSARIGRTPSRSSRNYIPLEDPAGGPNFFEFGDDVLYRINIDNTGDGKADIVYEFRFDTKIRNPNTFLYNTGPIDDARQHELQSAAELLGHRGARLSKRRDSARNCCARRATSGFGRRRTTPVWPTPRSTTSATASGSSPDSGWTDSTSTSARSSISRALRPFQNLHLIPTPAADGVNALQAFNVHTIAIQVPIKRLTRSGKKPTDVNSADAVIGVWASAHRQKSRYRDENRDYWSGPYTQVSRLGNPLFNEVIVPMSRKDRWNERSRRDAIRSSRSTSPSRNWPSCCRCCTRASSRTSPPTPRTERTCSRSC